MARVRLHGDLQRFGRVFDLDIATPAEAIRAISYQVKGFREAIESGEFRLRLRRHDVEAERADKALNGPIGDHDVFHIVPVASGSKKNGLFSVIAGVVMVAAAFYTGGASISAWGAMSTGLAVAGGSMVISGATMMLTPMPKGGAMKEANNGRSNSSFSSLDNRMAQGGVVPLAYGEVEMGSALLSQELETV